MASDLRLHDSAGLGTIARIIRQTLREGPPRYRQALLCVAGASVAMLAFQIWDVWGRSGPGVVAELLGVAAGVAGMALVGLMNLLHAASDHALRRNAHAAHAADDIHAALIALPAIGFAAGALLSASAALYIIRGALGSPLVLAAVITLFDAFLIVVAARTVNDTTSLLYLHARERAAAAARAEAQAAEARFTALQAQMNPHFLFNALNTVAALTRTDPRGAEATVEDLADVLRRTLARSASRDATLGDELEYLRAYLAIERRRMGDRLRVEWDVPDALASIPLPPMALQPLVENALKHGIGARLEGGAIRVSATVTPSGVRIAVHDDGEGFARHYREGTGLANLRERLMTVYGPSARLEIDRQGRGTCVAVTIPRATGVADESPHRR